MPGLPASLKCNKGPKITRPVAVGTVTTQPLFQVNRTVTDFPMDYKPLKIERILGFAFDERRHEVVSYAQNIVLFSFETRAAWIGAIERLSR
jgi:hypothetical protein